MKQLCKHCWSQTFGKLVVGFVRSWSHEILDERGEGVGLSAGPPAQSTSLDQGVEINARRKFLPRRQLLYTPTASQLE